MSFEWRISADPVSYNEAISWMEQRVEDILLGHKGDTLWLLEHPALYTGGTSAKPHDLLNSYNLPVYMSGRGGQYTYHGPGQRIGYVMMHLSKFMNDIRAFIWHLEEVIILTLKKIEIDALRCPGKIGIWVETPQETAKIAAIGVRVRRSITYHGFAVNLNPELHYFKGIVPCGISDAGVTSCEALGKKINQKQFDLILQENFRLLFERE